MKQLVLLILLSAFLTGEGLCSGDTLWTKHYGTREADGAYTSCLANDTGVILGGYSYGNPASGGTPDGFLLCIDGDGSERWRRMIDLGGWEYVRAIAPLHDKTGYILTGYILTELIPEADLFVLVTDNEGNTLYFHTYGGSGSDMGMGITPVSDGNYLIAGSTTSFGAGEDDFYYLKVDNEADTLWTRAHGCPRSDVGYDCGESGGYYYLCGSSGILDNPGIASGHNSDIYLLKTTPDGVVVDSANYYIMGSGQGEFDAAYSLCVMQDGTICLTGACSKESVEAMNVGILRVDQELNLIWKKNLEPGTFYDFGYAVCEQTADNGLLVSGSLNHAITGGTEGFIMKMNSDGKLEWKTLTGMTGFGALRSLCPVSDDSWIVSGYADDLAGNSFEVWSLKIIEGRRTENQRPVLLY